MPFLVFILVVIYGWFAIAVANPAIDRQAELEYQQWLKDKKKCESRGGIAIRSWWDGRMSDCKFHQGGGNE